MLSLNQLNGTTETEPPHVLGQVTKITGSESRSKERARTPKARSAPEPSSRSAATAHHRHRQLDRAQRRPQRLSALDRSRRRDLHSRRSHRGLSARRVALSLARRCGHDGDEHRSVDGLRAAGRAERSRRPAGQQRTAARVRDDRRAALQALCDRRLDRVW